MRRTDPTTLVGGLTLVVVGIFLLLDSLDEIDLTAGWAASLLLAAAGATILAGGLAEERDRRR